MSNLPSTLNFDSDIVDQSDVAEYERTSHLDSFHIDPYDLEEFDTTGIVDDGAPS